MNIMDETNDEKPAVNELCRLCAHTDKQFIPIFQGEGIEHNIAEQIQKYLPIVTVTKADELPLQICYQCTSTLLAWHNFFEQCRVADHRLREITSNVKCNEDDGSFLDYTDDFHDDFEDQTVNEGISDNTQEEIVLPEIVISDTQVMETSDNNIVNISHDVIESANEDHRYVAPAEWVPLATKRRISPAVKEEPSAVRSKKIRLLDRAAAPTSTPVQVRTAPKDDVIFTPLVLIPTNMLNIPSTPAGATRSSGRLAQILCPSTGTLFSSSLSKPQKAAATTAKKTVNKDYWTTGVKPAKEKKPIINCDDCQFTTKSMVAMLRHYKSKHPEGLKDEHFFCFHCSYVSQRKAGLKRHIHDVHMKSGSPSDQVTCAVCWRNYANKKILRRHIQRQHHGSNEIVVDNAADTNGKWNYGYCCDICGRGYEKQIEMLAHRDVYHPSSEPLRWPDFQKIKGKLKKCATCRCLYRVGSLFGAHTCVPEEKNAVYEGRMNEALRTGPKFRCDLCPFSAIWKHILRQHREKTHTDAAPLDWDEMSACCVPHYCIHCYSAFDEVAEAAQHICAEMEMETKPKAYVCSVCDVSFPRRSAYRRHCQVRHGIYEDKPEKDGAPAVYKKPKLECPYCEHTQSTRARMLTHIKEAHNIETDSPYMCVPCCKVFQRRAILDAHNQIYHPTDEKLSAENQRILTENLIIVNGDPTHHCSVCNRNYAEPMRFLTHYRLHFAERKFVCHLCGKQTRTQNHLKTHIRNFHLDIRNHECDICHKRYHSRLICEQHRRIHTGERPYSCEVCGKTFISHCALLTHKKFHDDFYPHKCHLCPKMFKIRRCLTNHIRTHTGERPFSCDLCQKTFSDPSRFSYHKKVTHSEERRVACQLCGNRYKAKKYLSRHMKKEHPEA